MTTTHKILTGGREIMTIESKDGCNDHPVAIFHMINIYQTSETNWKSLLLG